MVAWTAYFAAIRNYGVFSGRSTRSDFWGYAIIVAGVLLAAAVGDRVLVRDDRFHLLFGIAVAAHALPTLAVGVRRVHDIDFSAWVLLIGLIPWLGWIILFLFAISPTSPGTNKFELPRHQPSSGVDNFKPRLDMTELGRNVRRFQNRFAGSWTSRATSFSRPLPEPPASLAIELGLEPDAPQSRENDGHKRLRLEALRSDGMLSEAEFIRLVKGLK